MSLLLQDVRYALRQLRRSPGFALIAVLTLGLGIAANVVVFGVVDTLLLHSLPVPNADRVFSVEGRGISTSFPDYRDLRDRNSVFSGLALVRIARVGMDVNGQAAPVWGYEASANYFDTLGLSPAVGRFFHPADDHGPNSAPYVVLSYACWQARFGGDPNIAGRTVRINKLPYTVLGVTPRSFFGTERFLLPEFWAPVQNEQQIEGYSWLEDRGSHEAWMIARLKPGITHQQADADVANIARQLAAQYPGADKFISFHLSRPGFLGDAMAGPVRAFMWGVMLMAALVLLAACLNLGGLFAARTSDRAREMGIRIAIGSSRSRIFRQLLTESVLIAILGGGAASLAASVLLHLITQWRPSAGFPVQVLVEPQGSLFLFASLVSLATGILFGSIPARQIWKTDPNQAIRNAGSSAQHGRKWMPRDILLACQIALCSLLVTASFVALRGLERTFSMPLGFDTRNRTLAALDVQLANYPPDDVPVIQRRLLDEASGLPGVQAAAFANSTPLSLDQSDASIFAPGTTDFSVANDKFYANFYQVSPRYFEAAGTRLLAGRSFRWTDDKHAPRVVVVNQTFARQLFGTDQVVGRHYPTGPKEEREIIGVVEDGKYVTLTEDPKPAVFESILQSPNTSTVLVLHTQSDPAQMVPALRQAIARVDRGLPVLDVSSWTDALSIATLPARAATVALGILGALAVLLAVTGIFGLASYSVAKRLRELGIRSALGASSREILRAALGRTVVLLATGSAVGLVLGIAVSRVLASIVYQASAQDPVVLIAVALMMILVGLVSASLPARRAVQVEPAKLLREQ